MSSAATFQERRSRKRSAGFESPWPFIAGWLGCVALFSIVALLVVLHRQQTRQTQVKRLAAAMLIQEEELRSMRGALLAMAGVERITGDSVQALIDSQRFQARSIKILARRRGLLAR